MQFDLFTPKAPPLFGLDISSSSVKMLEIVDAGKGSYRVERYAIEPLARDAVVDGNINNLEAVTDAVRRAHKRLGTRTTVFYDTSATPPRYVASSGKPLISLQASTGTTAMLFTDFDACWRLRTEPTIPKKRGQIARCRDAPGSSHVAVSAPPRRSSNAICAGLIFWRAISSGKNFARSTSGNSRSSPECGGHSISKVLHFSWNASGKSPSNAQA